ncbi:MAG: LLM class flavin-dependent oxidoreductase [Cytophagales bacterium]|nr:LLM class flavin-dependent oxidoreductase [Cytophagales bacterium]
MEIGVDSFAAAKVENGIVQSEKSMESMAQLLERIELADHVGLDIFGIGEHHRKEFLDSAPAVILSAAATRTKRIRLTSAVSVLSAADPVRVFQNFATLDLISQGRAEMVVGRGSFIESFPLFGYHLEDYDALFVEKLELLLKIRKDEIVSWKGKFRPSLHNQAIFPRPFQKELPIWVGVGGTPSSFVRAGMLGLPLMIAVIGGETHRFRPLVDMYREAGVKAGFSLDQLKVGLHSLGYIGVNSQEAIQDFYPGYAETFTRIGRERGWPPVSKAHFDAQNGPTGALLVGGPEEIAEKIRRHSEALGGITRLSIQMDNASLPQEKLLKSIELLGTKVSPLVNGK